MSAYLQTVIDGNKSFGGYLSVDGGKSFAISDDMTYELSPGHHSFVIYSTSEFERKSGKLQATLYNNTSSSGAILDAMERHSAIKNLGDGWEISIVVEDHQMVILSILSKGSKLVGDPMYKTVDLSHEEVKELEVRFEEWKNTPVRSKKKMIWGAVIAFLGAFGASNALKESPVEAGAVLVMLGIAAVGVLLFIFGFRKKIRRK